MIKTQLGRLQRISARDIFGHEALDFTPWLAVENNLQLLSDALGLQLALESEEKSVGRFRADLLAKDTKSNGWVLVENQLDRTDHVHLGQILTYASGLKASTIIWVAGQFTDEHRAALDWLNASTLQGVQFFGVEIEFWRIGQSEVAPKFHVVSSPNNWTRAVSRETSMIEGIPLLKRARRGSSYEQPIRDLLEENPNITATEASKRVGCSHVTAGTVLRALRDLTSVETKQDESDTGEVKVVSESESA